MTVSRARPLLARVASPKPVRSATGSTATGFDGYVTARGADLLRTAFLLTGDHQRAEDLVQTALAKVWPHWERVAEEGAGSPHAYVRRVMLTTYIAWWRRRWTGEQPTSDLPEVDLPDEVERVAQRQDLLRALATLPRGQRAAVVLRYFDDLTEAQAAEMLGCSVGTVKSQCAKALTRLRTSPFLADGGDQP